VNDHSLLGDSHVFFIRIAHLPSAIRPLVSMYLVISYYTQFHECPVIRQWVGAFLLEFPIVELIVVEHPGWRNGLITIAVVQCIMELKTSLATHNFQLLCTNQGNLHKT
jgi:hypothetical protein